MYFLVYFKGFLIVNNKSKKKWLTIPETNSKKSKPSKYN